MAKNTESNAEAQVNVDKPVTTTNIDAQQTQKKSQKRTGVAKPAWSRKLTLNTSYTQRVYNRVWDRLKADIFVLTVRTVAMGYVEAATAAEKLLSEQIEKIRADLSKEIERSDYLMEQCGITDLPSYDGAKTIAAEYTSPFANQYLTLIEMMDQSLLRLDALWLTGQVETAQRTNRSYEWQRRLIKLANRIRALGDQTRSGLRKQAEEAQAKNSDSVTEQDPEIQTDTETKDTESDTDKAADEKVALSAVS